MCVVCIHHSHLKCRYTHGRYVDKHAQPPRKRCDKIRHDKTDAHTNTLISVLVSYSIHMSAICVTFRFAAADGVLLHTFYIVCKSSNSISIYLYVTNRQSTTSAGSPFPTLRPTMQVKRLLQLIVLFCCTAGWLVIPWVRAQQGNKM